MFISRVIGVKIKADFGQFVPLNLKELFLSRELLSAIVDNKSMAESGKRVVTFLLHQPLFLDREKKLSSLFRDDHIIAAPLSVRHCALGLPDHYV